jgi:transposase-like protein
MRYAAAEKLEIIRLVEQSSISVRRTLTQLGIPRSTFYCWYDRYRSHDAVSAAFIRMKAGLVIRSCAFKRR